MSAIVQAKRPNTKANGRIEVAPDDRTFTSRVEALDHYRTLYERRHGNAHVAATREAHQAYDHLGETVEHQATCHLCKADASYTRKRSLPKP
jgi:hypothetical protein